MRGLLTYFVFFPRKNLWKIGRTRSPGHRTASLRSKIGKDMEIHAFFKHSEFGERDMLNKFSKFKIKGETFRDCKEIRSFLSKTPSLIQKPIKGRKSIIRFQKKFPKKRVSLPLLLKGYEFDRICSLAKRHGRKIHNLVHLIIRHAIWMKGFSIDQFFLSERTHLALAYRWDKDDRSLPRK